MSKLLQTALLVGILFLGVCYGQERAMSATREAQLTQLKAQALAAEKRTAELTFSYAQERQRGDSLAALARFASRRRDRVVASSDSLLVLADSLASLAPTDSTNHREVELSKLVLEVRASLLSERHASEVVIASLERTVVQKDVALAAADSVILAQGEQLAIAHRTIQVLRQRPPWYRRFVSGATKVFVGVAIGSVVARLP